MKPIFFEVKQMEFGLNLAQCFSKFAKIKHDLIIKWPTYAARFCYLLEMMFMNIFIERAKNA